MSTLADLRVKVGVDETGTTKGTKQVESKWAATWDRIERGAALAGAAIGAALVAGAIKAMDTESIVDKMNAGLGATAEESARFGEVSGRLYADAWGSSMGDVTSATEAVVSSVDGMRSASGAALEGVTAKALAMATTFEVDVARAAQIAGQTVRSGLARDVDQAMDLMTVSLQRVPKHVREDLLDALDEYGPFLKSLGVTGEKAFGLLVKAADKGMYGIDKAGDALKEFTIRATDMSTASKAGFDILGMSQVDATRKILAGGDVAAATFQKIVSGILSIKDPAKQSQAALALFGPPLEDLSVQEIPKFLSGLKLAEGGLGDVAGAADKMSATLNDNAKTRLETFKRKMQGELVDGMAKAVGWMEKNQTAVKVLAGSFAALLAIVLLTTAAVKIYAAVQAIIKVATAVWTAAQWALNVALTANPIGAIIMLIVALIAVIVLVAMKTHFFQDVWKNTWGAIRHAAEAVGRWFRDVLWGQWIQGAWHAILAAGNRVGDWFAALPGRLKAGLAHIGEVIAAPFRAAFNRIASLWNNTVGRLSFTVPGWVPGLAGKGFSMPKIPMLADGAIVPARPGGTLALIGEGGRDEAVIPLPRGVRDAGRGEPAQVVLSLAPASSDRQLLSALLHSLRANGVRLA